MDKAIPIIIFVAIAAFIVGAKYYQMKDALSSYFRPPQDRSARRLARRPAT